MNIEIHRPELEALIRQRMASGRFQSVEEALEAALRDSAKGETPPTSAPPRENLEQMFAKVRGLFADGELDFRRDPSPGRPVDLS